MNTLKAIYWLARIGLAAVAIFLKLVWTALKAKRLF
jgi:hypothetical protein